MTNKETMEHTTPTSSQPMPEVIHQILYRMDTCITEQESIIDEEREAMKVFDAAALASLVERRARSQSTLDELESQCHMLCHHAPNIPDTDKKMSYIIENYAAADADHLQNSRIELVRRMQTLERDHIENHIRLRAAWNVTTNILQQIGAIEVQTTYQNTSYAQQAAR